MAKSNVVIDAEDGDTPTPEPTFTGADGVLYSTAEEALASFQVAKLDEEKTELEKFVNDDGDDLSDIDEDLQFSTVDEDAADEDDREFVWIALDGKLRCKLFKPNQTAYMTLAGALSTNADNADRMYAIQNLMNVSLEEKGRIYIKNRALSHGGGHYDDKLLGRITDKIMTLWGDELDPAKTHNRAQKRAAKKAAPKAKKK